LVPNKENTYLTAVTINFLSMSTLERESSLFHSLRETLLVLVLAERAEVQVQVNILQLSDVNYIYDRFRKDKVPPIFGTLRFKDYVLWKVTYLCHGVKKRIFFRVQFHDVLRSKKYSSTTYYL
jgi:hypothetical protein